MFNDAHKSNFCRTVSCNRLRTQAVVEICTWIVSQIAITTQAIITEECVLSSLTFF